MGKLVDNLSRYSAFIYLFGAIVGFADPITDILTLVTYYHEGHKTWFGVALTFVILPCLLYPIIYWNYNRGGLDKDSRVRWALDMLLCGCNPFSVAVTSLKLSYFCLKNHRKICEDKKDEFGEDVNYRLAYGKAVGFIETVFESTPQFLIQLYVVVVQPEQVKIIQMLSLTVSFVSLVWSSVRRDIMLLSSNEMAKKNHYVKSFVSHLFLLSSRLFALGLFTVTFKWWIIGSLLLHSSLVVTFDIFWSWRKGESIGIMILNPHYIILLCLQWVRDETFYLLDETSGSEKIQRSWNTQLFSNLLFIVENIAMILSFYFVSKFSSTWYSLPVTVCVCLFSVFGCAVRLTHYYFLYKCH